MLFRSPGLRGEGLQNQADVVFCRFSLDAYLRHHGRANNKYSMAIFSLTRRKRGLLLTQAKGRLEYEHLERRTIR
jgi:hypothetical protein